MKEGEGEGGRERERRLRNQTDHKGGSFSFGGTLANLEGKMEQ